MNGQTDRKLQALVTHANAGATKILYLHFVLNPSYYATMASETGVCDGI